MKVKQSQQYIAEAEQYRNRGELQQARELYHKAANLQQEFIESLPLERSKTHSVYGLSAATLYYRAHQLDLAARLAHHLLAQEWIDSYSAARLEELLARIRCERILENMNRVSDPTSSERASQPTIRLEIKEGILRAVDLDRKKLSLDQDDGIKTPLTLSPLGKEELLGLMLNKQVRVTGYIPPRRKRWIVTDIDFAPAA